MTKVLVIGATSGTGFEASKLLLEKGFRVRAFVRNKEKLINGFSDQEIEAVVGDLKSPEGIPDAVLGVDHILFTAGVTKRPCGEDLIIQTEFKGMTNFIAAAKKTGFGGRFLFLSSIGVTRSSWASILLNRVKGKALHWRKKLEDAIIESGFDYTIIRAGFLMNSNKGTGSVKLGNMQLPLYVRYRIGRKDVAEVFVEALESGHGKNKIADAVWGPSSDQPSIAEQLENLE